MKFFKDSKSVLFPALDMLAKLRLSETREYADLFNALEDIRYLKAKSLRKKYEPKYI